MHTPLPMCVINTDDWWLSIIYLLMYSVSMPNTKEEMKAYKSTGSSVVCISPSVTCDRAIFRPNFR